MFLILFSRFSRQIEKDGGLANAPTAQVSERGLKRKCIFHSWKKSIHKNKAIEH
jgi:hypothetical protein